MINRFICRLDTQPLVEYVHQHPIGENKINSFMTDLAENLKYSIDLSCPWSQREASSLILAFSKATAGRIPVFSVVK